MNISIPSTGKPCTKCGERDGNPLHNGICNVCYSNEIFGEPAKEQKSEVKKLFIKITNQDIEKYANEIFFEMDKYFESTETFKKSFEKSKKNISLDNINFCLEKFLHAEFDYSTSGNRGLGRMSDYCPRLAAYFRNIFSKLSTDEIEKLGSQITTLIIKSYLFTILISDKLVEKSKLNSEQLFEKWIPQIYIFDFSNMSEDVRNMLFALIEKDYVNIKTFFKQHRMKPSFFGGDKTDEILRGYVAAGLAMRIIEKS